MYLILGMILVGRSHQPKWKQWLVVSLLSGDGLKLRPSGIIGSLAGAVIVTAVWRAMEARKHPPKNPNRRSGNPAKRNQS